MHNADRPEVKEEDRATMNAMRRTERFISAALANGRMETPRQKAFWQGLRRDCQALAGAAMENVRR